MNLRGALMCGGLVVVVAGAAMAVTAPAGDRSADIALPTNQLSPPVNSDVQRQMSADSQELVQFKDRYGLWHVGLWNELSGTPVRAFGEPVQVVLGAVNEQTVAAAAESFIDENRDLFQIGIDELELIQIRLRRDTYYVFFQQVYNGTPVYNSVVNVKIDTQGRLFAFGSEVHPDVAVHPWPAISDAQAEMSAITGLTFDAASDQTRTQGLVVMPVPWEDSYGYFLTYEVDVAFAGEGTGYVAYVNAADGEILWRYSKEFHINFTGNTDGPVVLDDNPTGNQVSMPFRGQRVLVNSSPINNDWSDVDGNFDIPWGGSTDEVLRTRFLTGNEHFNVDNQLGGDADIQQLATPGVPEQFSWDNTNSLQEEREPFYHLNVQRDELTEMDPGFPYQQNLTAVRTNVAGSCNAVWNGSVNLYRAGGGCISMGRIPSAANHEWGHGLTDWIYSPVNESCAMIEGLPDIRAHNHTGVATIGTGWQGPGTFIRTGDNTLTWAQAVAGCPTGGYPSGECHCKADVTMGAVWKMRGFLQQKYGVEVGDQVCEDLNHFALYGKPQLPHSYLIDILEEDDTDGNLNNGTPNWGQICAAFDIHGLPCPNVTEFLTIAHTPLGDTANDVNPYPVVADVTGTNETVDEVFVTYRVTGGAWNAAPMTPTGNPDEFSAEIPAQAGGNYVDYYISASGVGGAQATNPEEAPFFGVHTFAIGVFVVVIDDDVESDLGWTQGLPGDTATTGRWERDNPIGTMQLGQQANPEDDSSPGGVNCYFTEQGLPGGNANAADVDGGCTTLRSPVLDLTDTNFARISYDRWWYKNFSDADALTVQISTDGGNNWQTIEEIQASENQWTRSEVTLRGHEFGFTSTMQVQFIACDEAPDGIVEAAVDEFFLTKLDADIVDVVDAGGPARFQVFGNHPNPFNPQTSINFEVPSANRVSVRVYGVSGQLVRTLMDSPVTAGNYSVAWDGTDEGGRPVASGNYYYKVIAGSEQSLHKMTLLK